MKIVSFIIKGIMGKKLPDSAIVIFAKTPESGTAKTRIAAVKGNKTAEKVYLRLINKTSVVVNKLHYHVAYTGTTSPGSLHNIFSQSSSFFIQQGESLGDRLSLAFRHLYNQGYTYVCAIGTDCPAITPRLLQETFHILHTGIDTVIGPAHDGGYYLVACNKKSLPIFSVKKWSSSELLEETLNKAKSKNITYHLLKPLSDIDYWEDYVLSRSKGYI